MTEIARDGKATLIRLAGELDMANVPLVRDALERERERRPLRLTLDLADVEFLDSSAMNLFVTLHRGLRAEGSSLILANPSETVVRTMEVAHLHGLLNPTNTADRSKPARSRPDAELRAQPAPGS